MYNFCLLPHRPLQLARAFFFSPSSVLPFRIQYIYRYQPLYQGRTSLDKAPPVHFYTAVGGNMSTVLPNELFDVMLDAQESGIGVGVVCFKSL